MDKSPLYIHVDMSILMTAMWKDSRTPALAIVARGDQIKTVSRVILEALERRAR